MTRRKCSLQCPHCHQESQTYLKPWEERQGDFATLTQTDTWLECSVKDRRVTEGERCLVRESEVRSRIEELQTLIQDLETLGRE